MDGHTDTKRLERALISLNQQRSEKGVRGVTSSLWSIPAPSGRLAGAGAGSHPRAATLLLTTKNPIPNRWGNFPSLSQSAGMEAEPLPFTCSPTPNPAARARRCNLSLLLAMNK